MRTLYSILFILSFTSCTSQSNPVVDTSTIQSLDLERYMGKWYELARLPNSFEKGLDRVTAEYSLNPNGTVKVVNSGYKADGSFKVANGKGKTTSNPGVLKVSFFWIFYAQYRIFVLDPNYQYALVGSNNAKYLWILSRTPTMPQEQLNELIDEAQKRGFDTSKLIFPKVE